MSLTQFCTQKKQYWPPTLETFELLSPKIGVCVRERERERERRREGICRMLYVTAECVLCHIIERKCMILYRMYSDSLPRKEKKKEIT